MNQKILALMRGQTTSKPELRAESTDTATTIYLYDAIDSSGYYGISAMTLIQALESAKGKTVNLRINSPGGDVFEARAMATAIKAHGNVTSYVDGLAASAATYVATSANKLNIATGSMFMVHNAWGIAVGNKADMTKMASLLDKIDQTIINDYVSKTGKPAEEIAALMNAETWMNAEEAVAMGFADSVVEGNIASNRFDLSVYDNAPKPAADFNVNEWQEVQANAEKRLQLLGIR